MTIGQVKKTMKQWEVTILTAVVTILLTVIADSVSSNFDKQQKTNDKLIEHSATSAAFSANTAKRVERLEKTFDLHIRDFRKFERETRIYWDRGRNYGQREKGGNHSAD